MPELGTVTELARRKGRDVRYFKDFPAVAAILTTGLRGIRLYPLPDLVATAAWAVTLSRGGAE